MKSPWKKLSSRIVYKNNWFNVKEDIVIRPDGKKGIYGFLKIPFSVGALAINEKKEIFLIKEFRYPLNISTLEIPRGLSEKNETPIKAVKRELWQEAGITARKWNQLGYINTSPGLANEFAYIFLARNLVYGKRHPESVEKQVVIKIPFKKAYSWVIKNKINDGLTIAAILRAKEYLKL